TLFPIGNSGVEEVNSLSMVTPLSNLGAKLRSAAAFNSLESHLKGSFVLLLIGKHFTCYCFQ
ncbi:hypothetical protein OFM39_33335, partial [Escherichia coli]|nr:hypothetical protein [Escherichia coli]